MAERARVNDAAKRHSEAPSCAMASKLNKETKSSGPGPPRKARPPAKGDGLTVEEEISDSYAALLDASATDVLFPKADPPHHWCSARRPDIRPHVLVKGFSDFADDMLHEYESDDKYEGKHWVRRLAAYDEREALTPQRHLVTQLLAQHEQERKDTISALAAAVEDRDVGMEPEQLQEELDHFEEEVAQIDEDAEAAARDFESGLKELQAAAPRVAHAAEQHAEHMLVEQWEKAEERRLESVMRPDMADGGMDDPLAMLDDSIRDSAAEGGGGGGESLPSSPVALSPQRSVSRFSHVVMSTIDADEASVPQPGSPGSPEIAGSDAGEEPDWTGLGLAGASKQMGIARRLVKQLVGGRKKKDREVEIVREAARAQLAESAMRLHKQKDTRQMTFVSRHLSEASQPRSVEVQTEPTHAEEIRQQLHAQVPTPPLTRHACMRILPRPVHAPMPTEHAVCTHRLCTRS